MKRVLIGIVPVIALTVFAGAAAAQDKAKGEKVYADQKCSLCHSIAGKGNAKGKLEGLKLSDADIRKWILTPAEMAKAANATRTPAMPGKYASLPKDDLDNLVAYVSSVQASAPAAK